MKRIILGLLVALGILTGAANTALAQLSACSRWVNEPVLFRTHIATVYGADGIGGVDSVYASGIAKFDTTASVNTTGWGAPPASGTAVDSVLAMRLFIFDAGLANVTVGKTSATAESIYIKTQVSANNVDWHDLAIIPGQAPVLNAFTIQTTVNAAVVTFTSSTNTGVSGKLWSYPYYKALKAANIVQGNDIGHATEYPFIRWIIMGSRSLNHSYSVLVGHYE